MSEFNYKLTLYCTHGSFAKHFITVYFRVQESIDSININDQANFQMKDLLLLILRTKPFGCFLHFPKMIICSLMLSSSPPLDMQLKFTPISITIYQNPTGPEGHQNVAPTEYRESKCPFVENSPNTFF